MSCFSSFQLSAVSYQLRIAVDVIIDSNAELIAES
jgi:hypothetical protein